MPATRGPAASTPPRAPAPEPPQPGSAADAGEFSLAVSTRFPATSPPLLAPGLLVQRVPAGDAPPPAGGPAGARGLLVDDAARAGPGQMRREEFLAELRREVCATVEEALAGSVWSVAGCPFIDRWFRYYEGRDAAQVERAVHRYVPETRDAPTARDYVALVTARLGPAVRRWRETGEITGLPPGVSADLPPREPESGEEGTVSRLATPGGAGSAARASPEAVRASLGAGQGLEGGVRGRMEAGFGATFSAVRIHTDTQAGSLARDLRARAFAVGSDVAFAPGEYRPGTLTGDAVLAHELAHVLQQRGATGGASPSGAAAPSADDRLLERDATRAALSALARPGARRAYPALDGTDEASHLAAHAAALTLPEPLPSATSGLALRRCGVERYDPNDVDVGIPDSADSLLRAITSQLRGGVDADQVFFWIYAAHEDVVRETARRLRLQRSGSYDNDYRFLLHELQAGLQPSDWGEAARILGADPLGGSQKIDLTPGAQALLATLRAQVGAGAAAGGTFDAAIQAVRAAQPDDLRQVLLVLSRTFDPTYGSELHRIQALVKEHGTADQYRELIRLMHAPTAEKGLEESDPVLASLVAAEAFVSQQGGTTTLSSDEMLTLFVARSREVALTMLRESEAQLVRVLSRTEGGGAPAAQIDVESDKIVAGLNEILKTYFRDQSGKEPPPVALKPFDTVRPALEAQARQAGADTSEAALRRSYDRMVQIELYLIGAPLDTKLRAELKRVRDEISDREESLRTQTTYMGRHPLDLQGPAGAWKRRDQLIAKRRKWAQEIERLKPQREALEKGQRDLEAVLPLLGGLDNDQLKSLAKVKNPAEFDQMRDAALARILDNVEKVRKDISSGDLNLWLVEKVVERTKRSFGVETPPGNAAQKAWNDLADAQVAAAKKDAAQVREFLEILNAAALIAAIGTAVFTGGGSLALYVGIAGGAIGVGSAVYDVIDTRSKMKQAEELYGTGLTEETRLSDVAPEWRFLYMAWLNLGIQAVMAAFMLRGLGSAAKSALAGEEAAVEAEVRAMAKRLRARGAAAAEDDIVKATMAALREEGLITGATRGTSIYRVGPKLKLVGGPGKSLETALDAEVLSAPRVHGATLAKDATVTTVADEIGYAMTVPTKSGNQVVRINVRARATADLAPGPHGAQSGPGRLIVSRDSTGWKATIEIDQNLDPRDLRFVAGHELDEIADLVHRRPTSARPGDIARETQSAYFQPAGATRTATGRAVPVPAHDVATGAELKALMDDLARLRTTPGSGPAQLIREGQIDRLMREMGLYEPAALGDRAALLKRLGVDEAVAKRVEARALAGELQARAPASATIGQARLVTTMDEDLVEHLIRPRATSGSTFINQGVSGGHVTSELAAFEKANPEFAFQSIKVKPSTTGATYRQFDQFRWKGTGPPPASKALRPGGSKFNAADWDKSLSPKTAADDVRTLLTDAEDAWASWRAANPALAQSETSFGRGLAGTKPAAISGSNVEFSGFYEYTPATSTTPARWRIKTVFVDASWF